MKDIHRKYNKLIQYSTYKLILNINTQQMYIYKKQNKFFISDLTISDISQNYIMRNKGIIKNKNGSKYLALSLGNMIEIVYLIL